MPVVRFLHTSDWHLGISRYYLEGEAQSRFTQDRIDAIRGIAALAVEERCGFVLVCGDVFDSNHVERDIVVRSLEAMAETPRVTFCLLPGNHDPLDASSVYRSPTFTRKAPANVKVLEGTDPLRVSPDVELIGAPWRGKDPGVDLVNNACETLDRTDGIRIVVGHGQVDSFSHSHHNPGRVAVAELEQKLAAGLIHYVALGDRHSMTEVGDTGRIRFSGAPEPTDFREVDPGHVLLVSLDEDYVTVESRSVGRWKYLHHHRERLTGGDDLDELDELLSDLSPKERTVVRLKLGGRISLKDRARLDDLIDDHRDPLAVLQVDDEDLVATPDEIDLEEFGFSGFARKALGDLEEMAGGESEEALTAREALVTLRRLMGAPR